ncbi:hypothetical protein Gasu2_51410 [Galdieria sulphuraria]|nr:hypothetical protein Gasu2_51410 [Galdieria sulphuraria]
MPTQLSSRLRSMKFMKRKETEESKAKQITELSSASISSYDDGAEAMVVDETNISVLGSELSFPGFQGRSSFLKFNPRLESILKELRNSVPQKKKAGTVGSFVETKRERHFQHGDKVDTLKKKRRKNKPRKLNIFDFNAGSFR